MLKKVKPGDPLVMPATTYNAFVDAARDYLARQQDQLALSLARGARHSGIVRVRDDSGGRAAGACIEGTRVYTEAICFPGPMRSCP
jgi:hypothetical protein